MSKLETLRPTARPAQRVAWRLGGWVEAGERSVPEETPIAFSYQGTSYAVMMGTPADLQDFAVGFSLTERVIETPDDIEELEITALDEGVVLRMALAPSRQDAFWDRRRYVAGPSGCGLCGIDSLAEAVRPTRTVTATLSVPAASVVEAMAGMVPLQVMNRITRAVHAAAFWQPGTGIVALREDVGRHNALDKLAGALAQQKIAGDDGVVLLSSRISVEMVQKTAALGAGILVAVSAPTALAIRVAEAAGITLIAIARADGFEIFTHPGRILGVDCI